MQHPINKQMRLLLIVLIAAPVSLLGQSMIPNTISPEDKVYGLSKFWQEVNYNFVYLNKVDQAAWDSTYRALIKRVQHTPNDYEYYRELQRFCAMLNDGHTDVYFPDTIYNLQKTTMFGDYRLFIENIDGRAVVVRVNASKKEEIPPGSEIITVNGLPTGEYIAKNVAPYISSSTDYIREDRSMRSLLTGFDGDGYEITFRKPDGTELTRTLTHSRTEEEDVYPAFDPPKELLDFQWQPNEIAYVALNSFGNADIVQLFKDKLGELQQAKGLIIDLRYNGGGSSSHAMAILKHLTNDTVLYTSRSRTRMHVAMFKAWGSFLQPQDTVTGKEAWGMSKERTVESFLAFHNELYRESPYEPTAIKQEDIRVIVPTVFLTGYNTASAAEDMLIMADNQDHMLRMGEKTFGSTGQPFHFPLPGGGEARVCTKQDTYPDGREFVGVGIIPHVEAKNSFGDFLQKKDTVLEKALAYLLRETKQ